MDKDALIEITSTLADLHAVVTEIARQVNAHSCAQELKGAKTSIAALQETAAHQATKEPR